MFKKIILVQLIICTYLLVINCSPVVAFAKPLIGVKGEEFVLRAEFSTEYKTSTNERAHNISLAVSKINGAFLDVGQEFSFNKTVGKRTEQNGFKRAKIILNGIFVDGVGGGVCQVSTTLYNAVLRANLPVTEYHPHSLAVSYVDPSFDAMVNSGTADMRFVNDTAMPILIKATATNRQVKFSIYGKAMTEKVHFSSEKICEVPPQSIEFIDDETLFEGEQEFITYPKNGLKSRAFITVVKDGKTTTRLLRKDYYKPIRATIKRGTKKPPLDSLPKEGVG